MYLHSLLVILRYTLLQSVCIKCKKGRKKYVKVLITGGEQFMPEISKAISHLIHASYNVNYSYAHKHCESAAFGTTPGLYTPNVRLRGFCYVTFMIFH